MTALHWAGALGRPRDGQAPRKSGAKAGSQPVRRDAAPRSLHVGNVPMIETLLDAGADPNRVLGEGETPR
jgi:hypothetical protein